VKGIKNMKKNCISDIKKYHDVLFSASITDKDKMTLTSIIALLLTSNYKKFETDYEKLLLNQKEIPSEVLVNLAEEYLQTLNIDKKFESNVIKLWNNIKPVNNLNLLKKGETKVNLIRIIESFLTSAVPHIKTNDKEETMDFLGQMFAEINGHGANGKTGIVLTPYFLADFMTDLLELDYKTDILLDGACGTGSFLVTAYIKMAMQLEVDKENLTAEEYKFYSARIAKAIYGNDLDEQMSILVLTNFALLGMDIMNISNEDFFKLDGQYFEETLINKGILNPPFEYKPVEFIKHAMERIKNNSSKQDKKFVVICPPQTVGKDHKALEQILNIGTIKAVIEVQTNAFVESNISYGTSIFVFDLNKPHTATDKILYYDFSNSGYEYFKDSGLVDKYNTFETKKKEAIEMLKNEKNFEPKAKRTWTTFFDIPETNNFEITIDPMKIKINDVEETDLTKANQEIKTILKEKKELIDSVGNKIPATQEFIDYLVETLSEVN